jgi:hypothetical protein
MRLSDKKQTRIIRRSSLNRLRPPLCHPDPTRLSYYAAPPMTMYAAFIEDSRMKFD